MGMGRLCTDPGVWYVESEPSWMGPPAFSDFGFVGQPSPPPSRGAPSI